MSCVFYLTFLVALGRSIGLPQTVPFCPIHVVPFGSHFIKGSKSPVEQLLCGHQTWTRARGSESGRKSTESEVRQAGVLLILLLICWDSRKLMQWWGALACEADGLGCILVPRIVV